MDQINQGKATSKKGLYIVVGIVVVLLAGYFLRGGSPGVVGGVGGVGGVTIDQNLDGSATYSNSEGTVTVGGNKLPENWPSDAPTYPNATIQYSGSSDPQTGEKGSAVVFTTSDNAQKVADFYKRELSSKGWVIDQTAMMGASTVLTATKDTRTLGAYITDTGNGQVSVTISIGIPDSQ